METARSRGSTLVLLCMRIENLAALRAEYGPAAESSLSEVAKLLAGSFRRADILAQRSCVLPAFRNENRHAQSRHRSGGFIHVYSEPGQGSLFRVYLPAHEGMLAEGTSAKEPAPAHVEMRGSETILLAEDHESIREIARQILVNLGYRVLSACDGEEALRLCEKETPALAILDVIMPKLGGAAAASKLIALFAGLPILFTSGYSQDSENLAPTGADAHYLQKPYSPTTLGRLVREILDRVKKRGAS
jgi:CheY-like chemotaxis protein